MHTNLSSFNPIPVIPLILTSCAIAPRTFIVPSAINTAPAGPGLSLPTPPGGLSWQTHSQPLGPVISSYVSGTPASSKTAASKAMAAEVLAEKEQTILELRETNEVWRSVFGGRMHVLRGRMNELGAGKVLKGLLGHSD